MAQAIVPGLYRSVIDDVISGIQRTFIDENAEDAVVLLKQIWEKKLAESKALEQESELFIDNMTPKSINVPSSRVVRTPLSNRTAASYGNRVAMTEPYVRPNRTSVLSGNTMAMSRQIQPNHLQTVPRGVRYVTPSRSAVSSRNRASPTVLRFSSQGSAGIVQNPVLQQNLSPRLTFTVPNRLTPENVQAIAASLGARIVPQQINALSAVSQSNFVQYIGQQAPGAQYQVLSAQRSTVVQCVGQQVPGAQYQVLTTQQLQNANVAVSVPTPSAQKQMPNMPQLDGTCETSDEEDSTPSEEEDDSEEGSPCDAEELLNSADDETDEEVFDFDIDNVVVCQYDDIVRHKKSWKFYLKRGIINIKGKDYIFQKAIGSSEW